MRKTSSRGWSSTKRQRRVARLGVDEVAQRLVEQHDDPLGQRPQELAQRVELHELARRVVGVAQGDDARAVVDGRQHRLDAEPGDRDGVAVRAAPSPDRADRTARA